MYHVELLHKVPFLIEECCDLINKEWKRSRAARLRSIENSSDNFPMSLVLVRNAEYPKVIGHCKISKLPLSNTKVFLETVVIHHDFRGKGLGKYLMNEMEHLLKRKNIKWIYLSTQGQERFYEKLGYSKCSPINIYGCNLSDSTECVNDNNENQLQQKTKTDCNVAKDVNNFSLPPPPPPLPTFSRHFPNHTCSKKTFMKKYLAY